MSALSDLLKDAQELRYRKQFNNGEYREFYNVETIHRITKHLIDGVNQMISNESNSEKLTNYLGIRFGLIMAASEITNHDADALIK